MKASTRAIAFVTAVAVTLPDRVLLILCGVVATLALLLYLGIAMPAVWSAKPARRKAAGSVFRLFLIACTSGNADERQANPARQIRGQMTALRRSASRYPGQSRDIRQQTAEFIIGRRQAPQMSHLRAPATASRINFSGLESAATRMMR